MNPKFFIKKVWTSSPSDLANYTKKFLTSSNTWNYSLDRVLKNKKHMNTQYLIDRWERLFRIIENNSKLELKSHFDFKNKNCFEWGCGPLMGWGPIAIFRGVKKYYYYEPGLVRSVVESNKMKEKYYLPLFNELKANFESDLDFTSYYELVMNNIMEIDFTSEKYIDILLSNSVLEHIPRSIISSFFHKISKVCSDDCYFLHTVNYGGHEIGGKGFGSLYQMNANNEIAWLNLLRKSDTEKIIKNASFEILNSTVYHRSPINKKDMHSSWHHYSNDDLTAEVVLITGRKNSSIEMNKPEL